MSRATRWGVGLVLSMTLHASFLLLAEPWRSKRQSLKRSFAQKVVVRMVEKPRARAAASAVPAGKRQAAVKRERHSDDKPATAEPPVAAPTNYGDLLPGLGNLPLDDGGGGGGGGEQPFAPPSQAAATVGDELSGKLDIPLFYREQGDTAKATAKLALKAGSPVGWWFAYVSGDPLLRAVLFEALRDPVNASVVTDLFRELRTSELVVSLRQRTVRQPDPHERYAETVRLEGSKLIVERTLFVAPPVDGGSGAGITLPDAEAARAKRRDWARLKRLETSPAFTSPLENRLP